MNKKNDPPESISRQHLQLSFAGLVLAALILTAMGRNWWCAPGEFAPWAGDIYSRHNSQHLFDPYTFTHVLHGLGFYALLWFFLAKRTELGTRLVIAIGLESGWEVLENTEFIIQKFREDTLALGYLGDSIWNSITDILACGAGFLIAAALPTAGSLILFGVVEVVLIWWIRDSLMLNILMLLWPLESVRQWQLGGLLGLKLGAGGKGSRRIAAGGRLKKDRAASC